MPVELVPQRQHRMSPEHPRAGPAHHLPDALAHARFIAMDGAIGAGRLGLAEDATFEPPERVVVQIGAIAAQCSWTGGMMRTAIHPQHGDDHLEFARTPFGRGRNVGARVSLSADSHLPLRVCGEASHGR